MRKVHARENLPNPTYLPSYRVFFLPPLYMTYVTTFDNKNTLRESTFKGSTRTVTTGLQPLPNLLPPQQQHCWPL